MMSSGFSRPSFFLVFVGLVFACGGSGDAQLGGADAITSVTGGSSGADVSGNTGGQISGNTGGTSTSGGNTGGANNGGGSQGGASGNGGSNGTAGNKGSAGNNTGAGGTNGTGGTSVKDSGAAGSSAGPDGGAGSSNGSDAGSDGATPVQTVACPIAVITTLAPVPVRLPLCLLPDKCCYNSALSDGTCAVQTGSCGDTIDTFTCDGPEDCNSGSICCAYSSAIATAAVGDPAIIVPLPTNTICVSALKCASIGRTVCHGVSDCGQGASCAAGGGLPAPYKVCGPGILVPPVN